MGSLDLIIIVVYLVLMLGIGLYYQSYAGKSLENFFLAGRNIPGWLNGVSYTAAMVSADAATAYGGLAVVTGIFVCWWYLSRFAFGLLVGGVLFAMFWRRLGLFTSMEFYEIRYKGVPASLMRFWIAFRTSCVAMVAWTGITLLAAAKIAGPTVGLSKTGTILIVVPISFIYVFLSGYKGVVVSNFIQMVIFLAGALALALITAFHFGGPTGFEAALANHLGPQASVALGNFPPIHHAVFPLAAAIAWFFGQNIGYGGDAAPMGGAMEGQRILSSRSPRHAVAMYLVTAVTLFVLVLLVSLPCMAGIILWPELTAKGADRELVYGMLMKKMLPSGMMGLVAAAMLAGVMSTVADNLNFGGQTMLNDIYRRLIVRNASERHYLVVGKICMLIILGMSLLVVYGASLIFYVAVFMLNLSAAELLANWAQWWWWRFNGKARIAASFGGGIIFCIVDLGSKLLASEWAGKYLFGSTGSGHWLQAGALFLGEHWWYKTFIIMGLTTLLWVIVALTTKPDPDEVLDSFYRRARPLGSWGPVARRVNAASGEAAESRAGGWKPIYHGLWIAALGAIGVMALIVGLSDLLVGRYLSAGAYLVGSAILLIVFLSLLPKYLNSLEIGVPESEKKLWTAEPEVETPTSL